MSWVIFNVVEKLQAVARKQQLRLAEAIASNDLIVVKKLLQQGVDPKVRLIGQAGEPLIFLIFEKSWFALPSGKFSDRNQPRYCITAKAECLRLLLTYGADPNIRDSLGRTVLEMAILWCLPNIVKLLLLNGADPNLRDRNHQTPLMKTAIWGIQDARPMADKLQIIMYLLDSGAEIDAQTAVGQTALMFAVGNSRLEIVEFLVSNGASLSMTDRQGNRASDIISQGINRRQQVYLRKILTQPQLNIAKYKYQHLIPEGDRLLAPFIDKNQNKKSSL
ncbi:MAG: ankyrin repeat domain-containing protein [Cyanobacteria bacterium P01_G01_bin.67]